MQQYHAIAGDSMAGLFAVYALYRTQVFSRVASASGSLWYPGLLEYALMYELAFKICIHTYCML